MEFNSQSVHFLTVFHLDPPFCPKQGPPLASPTTNVPPFDLLDLDLKQQVKWIINPTDVSVCWKDF